MADDSCEGGSERGELRIEFDDGKHEYVSAVRKFGKGIRLDVYVNDELLESFGSADYEEKVAYHTDNERDTDD